MMFLVNFNSIMKVKLSKIFDQCFSLRGKTGDDHGNVSVYLTNVAFQLYVVQRTKLRRSQKFSQCFELSLTNNIMVYIFILITCFAHLYLQYNVFHLSRY